MPRNSFYHTQKIFFLVKTWITIQKVIRTCVICKIRNCQLKQKIIAPIPDLMDCRIPDTSKPCFETCYYDIAGPFHIVDNQIERKMYYLLVSCSRSRACHIEMIASRNTNDVLKAFKCFFSRRGYPTQMIADRESSFIRNSKEINRLFHNADKSNICSELGYHGIDFKFNFSYCAQYQSLAERIHRIVKRALETKLIRQRASIFEFHTYLCMIEHMINSRPISTIRTSSTDDFQTISPFQLMTGHNLRPIIPPYKTHKGYKIDELKTTRDVAKHMKFQDIQITKFWNFFSNLISRVYKLTAGKSILQGKLK